MGRRPRGPRGRRLILLDTHVWIQWVNGETRIRQVQLDRIRGTPAPDRLVHAFSLWEVGMLAEKKRVDLGLPLEEWLRLATARSLARVVPIDAATVVEMARLPGTLHGDPADRLLAASARGLGCPLLTADAKLLAYPHLETVG